MIMTESLFLYFLNLLHYMTILFRKIYLITLFIIQLYLDVFYYIPSTNTDMHIYTMLTWKRCFKPTFRMLVLIYLLLFHLLCYIQIFFYEYTALHYHYKLRQNKHRKYLMKLYYVISR